MWPGLARGKLLTNGIMCVRYMTLFSVQFNLYGRQQKSVRSTLSKFVKYLTKERPDENEWYDERGCFIDGWWGR